LVVILTDLDSNAIIIVFCSCFEILLFSILDNFLWFYNLLWGFN